MQTEGAKRYFGKGNEVAEKVAAFLGAVLHIKANPLAEREKRLEAQRATRQSSAAQAK